MGMDPLTIGLGLSAASGIYGAISGRKQQHNAQAAAQDNFNRQQQAYDTGQAGLNQKNQMLQSLILPQLGGSGFNTGQDGMMQQLRGLPDGGVIDSLRKLSSQDLNDQISQQRGQVGSLGQRFGTAQSGIEARLRERATVGLAGQYSQFAQQQQNHTLGLLSILSGQQTSPQMQTPQLQYPQQGQDPIAGLLGDAGNMAMLYPFLRGLGGGGGGGGAPAGAPYRPPVYGGMNGGGIPGSLFGGVRY